MSLSPYETHASSQNSLSSSQSHALLMIRPERDTETHTVFPSVLAGWRICVWKHVCAYMWLNRLGWIRLMIGWVNCYWANQKSRKWQRSSHWLKPATVIVTTTSVTDCDLQCPQCVLSFFCCASQHCICVMPSFQGFADAMLVFTMNPAACINT